MFSEELKMLIDAAIADGEITEKERMLLHKRATAEGVDPDELDMILDARILKMKKTSSNSTKSATSSSETALKKLMDKLQEIEKTNYKDIKRSIWEDGYSLTAEEQRDDAKAQAIRTFYVPDDRKEIIELLNYIKPYTSSSYNGDEDLVILEAYKDRFKEISAKATQLYPDDTVIASILVPEKKKGFFKSLFG